MEDIQPTHTISLEWGDGKVCESLERLHETIRHDAEEIIRWYLVSKKGKKLGAIWLRVWTVVAGTAAGIIPIVSQIMKTSQYELPPAWASVFLALAAALVLLDHYFGLSSGWMRYIVAELQLRQMTAEFEVDWEIAKARLGGKTPTSEELIEVLKAFRKFVTDIHGVVRKETDVWIREFEKAISSIDDLRQKS